MAKPSERHKRTAANFTKWLEANISEPLWRKIEMFNLIADVDYDVIKKKSQIKKAKGKKKKTIA